LFARSVIRFTGEIIGKEKLKAIVFPVPFPSVLCYSVGEVPMRRFVCSLLLVVMVSSSFLSAAFFEPAGGKFALSPTLDGVLSGSGVVLLGTDFLIQKKLYQKPAHYDGGMRDVSEVNALDRLLMRPYDKTLSTLGKAACYVSLLTPAVLLAIPVKEWGTIGVMYAESVLLSFGMKELMKSVVYRDRPYLYDASWSSAIADDGDWNCSFVSGHTTMAFTGAAFASYVFSSIYPDSPWKWPVVAGSYALALTTASLRIASGEHFLTDVLSGAVIGTLSGFLVPWAHTFEAKRQEEGKGRNTSLAIIPGAICCSVSF
jgi:membrane-associated phospholipid phosphatase